MVRRGFPQVERRDFFKRGVLSSQERIFSGREEGLFLIERGFVWVEREDIYHPKMMRMEIVRIWMIRIGMMWIEIVVMVRM